MNNIEDRAKKELEKNLVFLKKLKEDYFYMANFRLDAITTTIDTIKLLLRKKEAER